MKKQIIVGIAGLLVAALLFTTYALFLKDDGIEEVGDPFYTLTDETKTALSEIEEDAVIKLFGYDGDDESWEMIYLFSQAIAETNRDISVEVEDDGSFVGVRVEYDRNEKAIAKDDFFKKLYDGTIYAFDGEKLIVNAILSLAGKSELEISLRALSGYDTDGDAVTANGAPFIFPSVQRSQISYLTVSNSHGDYSIYKDGTDFYFGSSRAVEYNDEMFSQITTNCRYAVSYGKMKVPEGKTWDTYGLGDKDKATAHYSLVTEVDANGNYTLHTVYVGELSSTGNYYYARYIGGIFTPSEKDGEADKLVHNLSKDFIYFMPASSVDESIGLPETAMMKPTVVNAITNNEQLLTIDNIRIDLYGDGVSAVAKKLSDFNAAPNLSAIDTTSLTTVISDKTSADDYVSYADGWTKHIDVFGGFTSSNGKATYIDAALAKNGTNGEYKVTFGLLRDEANGAYLPTKVTLSKSYDGVNWHEIENGEISISHKDKTLERYELSFNDETTVKYIRIAFDVPQKAQTYVVFDEIRVYVDGDDAQPSSAIGGNWKLTAPSSYIQQGMNYSFLDMSNFNNFVQYIASLEGESVVACGIGDNGDATSLKTELLAKYGLDTPDKHFSFEYDGVVTNLYVSKRNENGKYYAYSTFTGEVEGKTVNATTDVIVELNTEAAPFLEWSLVEYLDHSLFSIYIVDITEMEITADGKTYEFDLSLDSEGKLGDVKYEGKSYDVKSFKYLYQSLLGIYMQDEYVPVEGENPVEYLRIKIHTETNSPEIVFYRVSSSKCYFTIDGQGSYYALVEDVNEAREKLVAYVNGEIITK